MKRRIYLLPFFLFVLNYGFCQYDYDQVVGEYIFQSPDEPIYEKIILKKNFRFGFERKTSERFLDEADKEANQIFKGLIGKYAIVDDKIILAPTKLWVKERGKSMYSTTDDKEIEELAYMPKTMFIFEEDELLFFKVNNDVGKRIDWYAAVSCLALLQRLTP